MKYSSVFSSIIPILLNFLLCSSFPLPFQFFIKKCRTLERVRLPYLYLEGLIDNTIDLSTNGDNGVLKQILRKGDITKGYPKKRDEVNIEWEIFLLNGTLVHSSKSELQEDGFSFRLSSNKDHSDREVLLGWDMGVFSMLEGEIASYTIDGRY